MSAGRGGGLPSVRATGLGRNKPGRKSASSAPAPAPSEDVDANERAAREAAAEERAARATAMLMNASSYQEVSARRQARLFAGRDDERDHSVARSTARGRASATATRSATDEVNRGVDRLLSAGPSFLRTGSIIGNAKPNAQRPSFHEMDGLLPGPQPPSKGRSRRAETRMGSTLTVLFAGR